MNKILLPAMAVIALTLHPLPGTAAIGCPDLRTESIEYELVSVEIDGVETETAEFGTSLSVRPNQSERIELESTSLLVESDLSTTTAVLLSRDGGTQ